MHGKVTRFARRPTRVEHTQAKKRFWAIRIGILHEYVLGGCLKLSHIAQVLLSLCWSGSNFCLFGTYMIQALSSHASCSLLIERRIHQWCVSWVSDLVQGNLMFHKPYSQMHAIARWLYHHIFLQLFLSLSKTLSKLCLCQPAPIWVPHCSSELPSAVMTSMLFVSIDLFQSSLYTSQKRSTLMMTCHL